MMEIFLDSDVLIQATKGLIELHSDYDYRINPIVYSEVLYGVFKSGLSIERFDRYVSAQAIEVLEITKITSEIYVQLRLELERRGKPLHINDLYIASTCLEYNMPLKTGNIKHFQRISGLMII